MRETLDQGILHIACDTAEQFLDVLRPHNPRWREARHRWCFRGHGDDAYELLPSALRRSPPARLGHTNQPVVGVQSTNYLQIWAELKRLQEFYWTADAHGLRIPEDSQLLRTPSGWVRLEQALSTQTWPYDEVLSLMAIAQHHGVPTRLLDWSDRPLIAAYFAARGAADHGPRPNRLFSVWALDLDWTIYDAWPVSRPPMRVYVVTAPRASNSNLNAQGGLFTTDAVEASSLDAPVTIEPVNVIVSKHATPSNVVRMLHVTAPSAEAGKALRLLHAEEVNAATIFPGFDGVAKALEERSLWDRVDRATYWIWPFAYPPTPPASGA